MEPTAPAPESRTVDGVLIAPGMAVWDYDLRPNRVTKVAFVEAEAHQGVPTGKAVVWWATENGKDFDGGRLYARHPSTHELP